MVVEMRFCCQWGQEWGCLQLAATVSLQRVASAAGTELGRESRRYKKVKRDASAMDTSCDLVLEALGAYRRHSTTTSGKLSHSTRFETR